MNWIESYVEPTSQYWIGRSDLPAESCYFQKIKYLNLNEPISHIPDHAFAILGFACDEGIRRNFGREGAAEGPNAIRAALARLAINRDDLNCFDAGSIICNGNNLDLAQEALGHAVDLLLKNKITPIVMGGGHELAYGSYQGIAKYAPRQKLGIINYDAHFDMRPLVEGQGNSGTPFLQIANAHNEEKLTLDYNCIGIQPPSNISLLFETARQCNVHYLLAEDLHLSSDTTANSFVERIIRDNEILYVSICLDVFAASIAPGVSAPQSMGVLPWQIIPSLRHLAQSGKVLSYDIAELSPRLDIDQRTAKLAAALIYEIMHFHRGSL